MARSLVRWFSDTSEDDSATEAFLDARIENVMQFEKFKAKAKEALSNFPAFAAWANRKQTRTPAFFPARQSRWRGKMCSEGLSEEHRWGH